LGLYYLFNLIEWAIVQFIEDDIFYMCPSRSIKNIEVGVTRMVKWKNRKFYEAKILEIGSKYL